MTSMDGFEPTQPNVGAQRAVPDPEHAALVAELRTHIKFLNKVTGTSIPKARETRAADTIEAQVKELSELRHANGELALQNAKLLTDVDQLLSDREQLEKKYEDLQRRYGKHAALCTKCGYHVDATDESKVNKARITEIESQLAEAQEQLLYQKEEKRKALLALTEAQEISRKAEELKLLIIEFLDAFMVANENGVLHDYLIELGNAADMRVSAIEAAMKEAK